MKFLVIPVFMCLSIFSKAQNRWGMQAGMNVASIHADRSELSDNYDVWDSRIGFTVGVFGEHNLTEKTGLRTELNYSLAGAVSVSSDRLDLHYLSVPVNFYFKPLPKLKVYAGPQLNFLIHATSNLQTTFDKPEDQFKSIDYGVLTGIEFSPVNRFGVSIRNYFGLLYNDHTTIRTYDSDGQPFVMDGPKINRNNIFQVCLQYFITKH